MERKLINSIARRHYRSSLWIVVALTLVAFFAMSVALTWDIRLVWSITISVLFSLVTTVAYNSTWKSLAATSQSGLSRFYLAAPALRMLAAAMVILCYGVIVRERQAVLSFVLIFCIYYVALLIFDCMYFAKEEKRNKIK